MLKIEKDLVGDTVYLVMSPQKVFRIQVFRLTRERTEEESCNLDDITRDQKSLCLIVDKNGIDHYQ